ncbi:right-handed parallel beta-helix repeat-containing protein [Bradyrhizobium iriomotense]|uniref:Outer membrane protein B n=1 Tax=Bradyrhizobium iriomotense TaxID=441950 RepID=A0ABQ6B526_9BRAD|nr:right-handed parallel beta-helix repeat-containing protein [Bradyrhizobium iriomotense]GLR88000.1 outer membrane protein B [Bradyrhizobium iriomotense]
MRRVGLLALAIGILVPLLASAPAHAQATRTWVSGVGDDANPCSRTAPCKTFAGAISKTAAAGEINCLDPGGFGAVTITKAITIDCETGTAGVLVSGTNAIVISTASSTDAVVLRGLLIDGLGTGLVGVLFLSGGSLIIENCIIMNFRGSPGLGVQFNPNTVATFLIKNSLVTNNGSSASGGGGVQVNTSGGSVRATIDHVTIERNQVGMAGLGTSNTQVNESMISNNASVGVVQGSPATVKIGRSVIVNNAGASTQGSVLSYLDNQVSNNNPDVVMSSAGGYK